MTKHWKFSYLPIAFLAVAVSLSACGGGGGGTPVTKVPPVVKPTPIECPDGQEPNAANDACVDTADTIKAKVAAATKAAGTKRTAIAAEASQGPNQQPQNDDAGLGGSASDGSAVNTYTLAISRDRDGTEIKVTDSGQAGANDPKFEASNGMLVRTQKADSKGNVVQERVMVVTDIEAPKGVAFAMWQDADGSTPHTLNVSTDTTNDTPDVTNEALAVVQNSETYALVKSTSFAPGSGSSVTYTFDGDDPNDNNDAAFMSAAGSTYRGAMGTYMCNGGSTDCTVTVDDKGAITAMSDNWVFIPDADATSDEPDYDYLHYGFWLKQTTDADGAVTYNEVETFAGSSVAPSGSVSAVVGTATYSGGATGVYVHSVSNPDGTEASATSGHFTADVLLNAAFGGGDVAANDQFRVSGTINNFALSGHETGPGWSVSLEKSASNNSGSFSGVAKGGGADGSYSGTFHGIANATTQPHTAVGEFNANFSNGSVAGAFGTRNDDD